jgi:hypothetical protein
MTDQELDQLVAEAWANAIDLSTHGAVSRNDVHRLLDALVAVRAERDRLQETLALADKQIEARDEYIKALQETTP